VQIGKKDIYWNYAATFLKIAASVLLLPLILNKLPEEEVGIWSVFVTITAFSNLFDFGFNPSFTRNISYIFSGVTQLKKTGIQDIKEQNEAVVDYDLLKGVINTMKWLYLRMSLMLFALLSLLGTYYIYNLLENYSGSHMKVYIAWGLLCVINVYNLYTLYYDCLLQGKGLIKISKQIIILGQSAYLIVAVILLLSGYGLIAIISAQAISVILIRIISHIVFFDKQMKKLIENHDGRNRKEILDAILPNSVKVGLTTIGSFAIQKSALIIGSLFIDLKTIASYGISMQLIGVIAVFASIYSMTFQPKIAQLRVENNIQGIKNIYLKSIILFLITYLFCSIGLVILGNTLFVLIGSQTKLLPQSILLVALLISLLENNHTIAGNFLMTKNEVPFFKASIISGVITIVLLYLFLDFTTMGVWAMVLAPGIAQVLYQNWKWPYEIIKDLKIQNSDFISAIKFFIK